MKTLGCIRAKMGNTLYYMAKMPAGELIDSVGIAKELPEWEEMTVDEKMQREVDMRRIVEEIVPYICNDPDRFFGSLIVDIYSGMEEVVFESISSVVKSIPRAYALSMNDMGFITLPGSERLIALDGQHRLLSLKIAIRGKMGVPAGTKPSPAFDKLEPHPEFSNEEISVIFVEHTDTKKIRKIFNKINKYAKQTSRSDNIITSDDDPFAVISRRLVSTGEVLAPIKGIEVVNSKNNTLSKRSKNLTTLSTLYTSCETLLKDRGFKKNMLQLDSISLDDAYGYVSLFWNLLLKNVEVFRDYIRLTNRNMTIQLLREKNLLLKPVTQMALAHVAAMAKAKGIEWDVVTQKLNAIDWSFENDLWFNILVIGSTNKRMITGKDSVRYAGMVISYMIMGDEMSDDEKEDVSHIIKNARNNDAAEMPVIIR
ncbi:hypothetical protein MASR1M31_25380 [Porphyromonadaceae bacterium]